MAMNGLNPSEVIVIMAPFPCYSHLNQLLQLSCIISSYNIPVHYACSTTHINQVKVRFSSMNKLEHSQIIFHELLTPPFDSPPPNPNSDIKFPSHLQSSFDISLHLREPFVQLFHKISSTAKRVVIVHDVLMSYSIQDIATMPRVETYVFNPTSAFYSYYSGKQMSPSVLDKEKLPEGLPSLEGCFTPESEKLVFTHVTSLKPYAGSIINSSRSIEGNFIDLRENDQEHANKLMFAIGPMNIWTVDENKKSNGRQHMCLEWLDKQAPNSVIYVSFGTTVSLTCEQVKELALGLEQSGQKFVWVLKDADKGNIFEEVEKVKLPRGYEDRVNNMGIVLRDWAPQLEILRHPSIGGFMNHCGWNSCLDGIISGVPMATWPMHSDQPKNAFLITDILKVGLAVINWENRKELVASETIANVVKRLMTSKEAEEMSKRVKDLCKAAQVAVEEGGDSHVAMDSFIAHIKRQFYVQTIQDSGGSKI